MAPNHEQLTDATTRFVARVQGRIAALQQERDKAPRVTHDALVERAVETDPAVRRIGEDFAERLGSELSGVDASLYDTTVDFNFRSGAELRNCRNAKILAVIEKLNAPDGLIRSKPSRQDLCNHLDVLARLLHPPALTTWRTYVRAQWSPAGKLDRLPDATLTELYVSYLAVKSPQVCAL